MSATMVLLDMSSLHTSLLALLTFGGPSTVGRPLVEAMKVMCIHEGDVRSLNIFSCLFRHLSPKGWMTNMSSTHLWVYDFD